jgi:hypothetical protein
MKRKHADAEVIQLLTHGAPITKINDKTVSQKRAALSYEQI